MTSTHHVSKEDLRAYLAGWMDEHRCDNIEIHLAECETCEETLVALEEQGDTLLERIRQLPPAPAESSRNPNPLAEAPPPFLGAYEILRPIGRGGMGAVYLAKHRQLQRNFAIKVVPVSARLSDQSLTRFDREIRAAGGLEHAAIVTTTDAGHQDQFHYLVMEYIDGLDLSQIAKSLSKLPIADACQAIKMVADGLAHAHHQGVVHRDIKPSNLMIHRGGEVKILDFGLARLSKWDDLSVELTTVGQLMGTLDYMAPEQAERPESVDYRADLYSLGATLFRLICGRAPLSATPHLSPLAKLRLLADHEAPRVDTLRADVPTDLADLVESLLARDPADRPASASHVSQALQPFCARHDLARLVERAQRELKDEDPETVSLGVSAEVQGGSGGKRHRGWWVAAAAFPFFLFAAITILIQTTKGQLVIESEVGDVVVRVMQDQEIEEELRIRTGVNSTRLHAGQYEIVLASPSDSISVVDGDVQVERGTISITKIQRNSTQVEPTYRLEADNITLSNAPPPSPLNAEPAADSIVLQPDQALEPLYDGKPLSSWLLTIAQEHSYQPLEAAITALRSLSTPSNASQIAKAVLEQGPRFMKIDTPNGSSFNRSCLGMLVSLQANEKIAPLLIKELRESNNTAWKKELLSQTALVVRKLESPGEYEKMQPLFDWLQTNVLAGSEHTSLIESAAKLFHLLADSTTPNQDWFAQTLAKSSRVEAWYWLSQATDFRSTILIDKAIQVCRDVLVESESTNPLFVAALVQLPPLLEQRWQSSIKRIQEDVELKSSICSKLDKILRDEELVRTILRTPIPLDPSRTGPSRVPWNNRFDWYQEKIGWVSTRDRNLASPAFELLDLVAVLRWETEIKSALEECERRTAGTATSTIQFLADHHINTLRLQWPVDRLQTRDIMSQGGEIPTKLPSHEEWMDVFLHVRVNYLNKRVRTQKIQTLTKKIQELEAHRVGLLDEGMNPDHPHMVDTNANIDHLMQKRDELINLQPDHVIDEFADLDPRMIEYAKRILSRYDKNKDDVMDAEEMKKMPVKVPAEVDLDSDGKVSVKEYAIYMQERSRKK